MADSKLLTSRSDSVQVDYSIFYIEDEGEAWFDSALPQGAVPPEAPADDELVRTGLDWISIASNVNYHVAGVRLELWRGEPPQQDDWEAHADVAFSCTTGNVYLSGTGGTQSEEAFELGGPGTYHGRVHSRGREEAREALGTSGEVPERMEQYLCQFWAE
ncbi:MULTISPECIES: hypothetical protein [unclassified Pseudofrankia]|uniref:hypothetical protein n=1 Tax=unclassified Pseudofrankia TaxID=2994372 RepID=UPI0008D8DE37|nr:MULTISPECIES: hypothetical protein [unclassified Pseudofrankia]MDT3439319.1 hypothetical protein [Pseudofrankia sp. BMG5.37]OHV73940.1 hypothetical protein BCD48_32885 [Pseudofrankia sp. BMG5.36]